MSSENNNKTDSSITLNPEDVPSGTFVLNSSLNNWGYPQTRIDMLTGKLRWTSRIENVGNGVYKVLQQQWVNQKQYYDSVEGPDPIYTWVDVPVEEE